MNWMSCFFNNNTVQIKRVKIVHRVRERAMEYNITHKGSTNMPNSDLLLNIIKIKAFVVWQ